MIPINRRMNELRAIEILKNSEYAVLSTVSIDNIKNNPNVSLFILENQKVIPDRYITHYESIVVTGKASIILDEDEIRKK